MKAPPSILLVKLHRCKLCKVRMFERDRRGHMGRHGIKASDDELDAHFKPGPKDTPAIVGGTFAPLKKSKKPRG